MATTQNYEHIMVQTWRFVKLKKDCRGSLYSVFLFLAMEVSYYLLEQKSQKDSVSNYVPKLSF